MGAPGTWVFLGRARQKRIRPEHRPTSDRSKTCRGKKPSADGRDPINDQSIRLLRYGVMVFAVVSHSLEKVGERASGHGDGSSSHRIRLICGRGSWKLEAAIHLASLSYHPLPTFLPLP